MEMTINIRPETEISSVYFMNFSSLLDVLCMINSIYKGTCISINEVIINPCKIYFNVFTERDSVMNHEIRDIMNFKSHLF